MVVAREVPWLLKRAGLSLDAERYIYVTRGRPCVHRKGKQSNRCSGAAR